ncbi:hypothetical protein DL98DRAFT_623191 [Cadophora sp. DSE1049]|nr:hypothetical protein DL98DRAFT_623191 [Cadophora sp. DSE1049]
MAQRFNTEITDLTGLSTGEVEVLLITWDIASLSARYGYVGKQHTELGNYWRRQNENNVGEKLEQLRIESIAMRESIEETLKTAKEKQMTLVRQAYPNMENATDPEVRAFIASEMPKYVLAIKAFLPANALETQKFFDVGRDAYHIARRNGNYGLSDGDKQVITVMVRNSTSDRRFYHTGSPLTLPSDLFFEKEVSHLQTFQRAGCLNINALAFDEGLASRAGYKADGRKMNEGDWTWALIFQAQGIPLSLYSALVDYGKNTTASATIGGLRSSAIADDSKAESSGDTEGLSPNDMDDHQEDDSLGGEDVEMMDAGEGPSTGHLASTDPDETEDEDEEITDAPPTTNNAPKTTRKRRSRAKAASSTKSEKPTKKGPRNFRPVPPPNLINVTDEMKSDAKYCIQLLTDQFKPNMGPPDAIIKKPLNLFNRPAGRGPTEQPKPPKGQVDPFHFRKLRGNPPPGVVLEHWDKAFNSAHSLIYALYKSAQRSQIFNDELRQIAWDAARENGSLRDVAICILVERDQMLLPFRDDNP